MQSELGLAITWNSLVLRISICWKSEVPRRRRSEWKIVDKIQILSNNVGDAAHERDHHIYVRIKKPRLLNDIIVLLLLLPMKASMLNKAEELTYCKHYIKVFTCLFTSNIN